MSRQARLTATSFALLFAIGAAAYGDEPNSPSPLAETPRWMQGLDLKPTYSGGIALLYAERCNGCHRPGEVAPMSFLDYDEIREWQTGDTNTPLESLIETRAMPPWPADPKIGRFANSHFLTQPEMELLLAWIKAGMPRGEGDERPSTHWVEGWNIGRPDAVFDLPEQTIGADERHAIREVELATAFADDRWVVAAEARPGDAGSVVSINAGPLGAYHPGNSHVIHPAGYGQLLEAGETLKVRLIYDNRFGVETRDRSRLGVVFAKPTALPNREILTDPMPAPAVTILAGAASVEAQSEFRFERDGQIVSLMPIMNHRGKSVRYMASLPDGTRRELLSIPSWNPSWKFRYQLAEPIDAPRGTVVEATAVFDNSAENLINPDPTISVTLGIDSVELFEGWIGYGIAAE